MGFRNCYPCLGHCTIFASRTPSILSTYQSWPGWSFPLNRDHSLRFSCSPWLCSTQAGRSSSPSRIRSWFLQCVSSPCHQSALAGMCICPEKQSSIQLHRPHYFDWHLVLSWTDHPPNMSSHTGTTSSYSQEMQEERNSKRHIAAKLRGFFMIEVLSNTLTLTSNIHRCWLAS